MRKPNLFIVGFGRSGTTSLYKYLRQHPNIFMAKEKEPNYFCTDILLGSERKAPATTLKEYLALFADAREEPIVGEASTLYILSEAAARNIHELVPEAKILIMLRNPVDMLYSWHSLGVRDGYEPETDFRLALNLEKHRFAEGFIHPRGSSVNHRYRYVAHQWSLFVKRYLDLFGHKQVLLIEFDRLKSQPHAVFKEILSFLGVSIEFEPEFHVHNSSKSFTRHRYLWMASFLNKYDGTVKSAREKILKFKFGFGIGNFIRKFIHIDVQRPMLEPELRLELTREFMPVIKQMEQIAGVDLSHWYAEIIDN